MHTEWAFMDKLLSVCRSRQVILVPQKRRSKSDYAFYNISLT